MAEIKTERLEHGVARFTITIGKAEFDAAINRTYKKRIGRINIPGFRRGKAPRQIIERLYGKQFFYEDAVEDSWLPVYEKACEDEGLETIGRPDVNVTEINEDGYTFTAETAYYPEVKLGQYKGVEAPKDDPAVTDKEIDDYLENLRSRNASVEQVEREARHDDVVTIDYTGTLKGDDEPFPGGTGRNQKLTIGAGQFIPGFEEQLLGAKAEDDVTVNVTFPDDYHSDELSGKEAVFEVHVREVGEQVKPELDDDFAAEVSDFDTLDEFKEDIRGHIFESKSETVENAFIDKVTEKIVDTLEADVPEALVEEKLSLIMQDFSVRMGYRGMSLDAYLRMTGQNEDELVAKHRDAALKHAKCELAYLYVAKAENLQVSEEEIEAKYEKYSEELHEPVEELKKRVPAEALKRDLLKVKASEFIKENAVPLTV